MSKSSALIVTLFLLITLLGFNPLSLSAQESVETTASSVPEGSNELTIAEGYSAVDTLWVLVASALVLVMTAPGLALFYGGLVRKKNILGVMMQCVFLMGLMSLVWFLWGYSLAFDADILNGFVGGFNKVALMGVLPYWDGENYAAVLPLADGLSIPEIVFMIFQMMFFIITPALICGAFAERMKFSAMCLFSVLWGTFVYCPLCHWVWSGNGWFAPGGPYHAFDFAGGTVVHISSGVSALVCALMIGKRLGHGQEPMPPHNLTYTTIGTALLWFGWFGFNAGSALGMTALAANAFVATHMCAATGLVTWAGLEWIFRGKPSVLGACSGAVAGLVCITPACGFVTPLSGIWLGIIDSCVCYFACTTLKYKFKYDDALDAFGIHGVGGAVGALLTGVFATRSITGATAGSGIIDGEMHQFFNQFISVLAAVGIAVVGTVILLKIVDLVVGLRVTHEEELKGLDLTQHGEEGYIFL
ncbi:MAG: ammonium transporter [Planctomycetaceae bacterium]